MVLFMEFSEYVNSSGVVVYGGDRSFKMSWKSVRLEMELTFLDNNVLIAIPAAEQYRD